MHGEWLGIGWWTVAGLCRWVTTHKTMPQISLWNRACGDCPLFMTLGSRKLSWLALNMSTFQSAFVYSNVDTFLLTLLAPKTQIMGMPSRQNWQIFWAPPPSPLPQSIFTRRIEWGGQHDWGGFWSPLYSTTRNELLLEWIIFNFKKRFGVVDPKPT